MAVTQPTAPIPVSINPVTTADRTVNVTSGLATGVGSFQAALTDATVGDFIVLPVNTYTGEFTLPVPSGSPGGGGSPAVTARPTISARPAVSARPAFTSRPTVTGAQQKYVTIISANHASLPADGTRVALADASNMPTIVASNSSASNKAISASAQAIHHYRFVGINFTSPQVADYAAVVYIAPTDFTVAANYPHHISFERCIMNPDYDYGTAKGFEIHGSHIQWKDCYITECKQLGQGDGNAIFGYTGKGPYKIHNCRVEGMGEIIFFGSTLNGGIPIAVGYEYENPADITITNNYMRRKLSWKRDHATFDEPCPRVGNGTFTSSGVTVTFSTTPKDPAGVNLAVPSSPHSLWIRDTTTGQRRKVTALVGTTGTIASAFSPDVGSAHSWTYNGYSLNSGASWVTATISNKGLFEFKTGQRVLIANNVCENGWADGQPVGGLQMTPREFGWLSDFEIKNNEFIDCCGFGMSVADPSNIPGFGSSPRGANRMWVHNNLFKNHNSTESTSLNSSDGMGLTLNTAPYGVLLGGNIVASATTGSGVTFTATDGKFLSSLVRTDGTWEIWLCDATNVPIGKATITGVTSGTILVGTVTSTFDSSATSGSGPLALFWRMGPSVVINTRYTTDSWVIEHNTFTGSSSSGATRAIGVGADEGTWYEPVQDSTNFVLRDNLVFHGANPNSAGGLMDQHNVDPNNVAGGASYVAGDTNLVSHYLDSGTKVINKNVWFGAQTLSGITYAQYYEGPQVGPTASFTNMFHGPDQGGGDANVTYGGTSGAVGFTDYAGGNYAVTGTYATAATDGTMIGCDISALNTAISGVAT